MSTTTYFCGETRKTKIADTSIYWSYVCRITGKPHLRLAKAGLIFELS